MIGHDLTIQAFLFLVDAQQISDNDTPFSTARGAQQYKTALFAGETGLFRTAGCHLLPLTHMKRSPARSQKHVA